MNADAIEQRLYEMVSTLVAEFRGKNRAWCPSDLYIDHIKRCVELHQQFVEWRIAQGHYRKIE